MRTNLILKSLVIMIIVSDTFAPTIDQNKGNILMKRFFISIIFIFCATFSFGQQKIFVWSTVSGSNARVISMSSVKAEVMRLYDRHSWMRFETGLDGEIFMNRKERRDIIVDLYNWSLNDPRADKVHQQHRRQIITWYDNYRNFVYMRDIGDGMLIISCEFRCVQS